MFSGKRYIDAGQPRQALGFFRQAFAVDPSAVARAWYKVIQAAGGALGLTGLFLAYRRLRRRLFHHARTLAVDARGPYWPEP